MSNRRSNPDLFKTSYETQMEPAQKIMNRAQSKLEFIAPDDSISRMRPAGIPLERNNAIP